jgi:DNA polymerase delta subunit 1
MLHVTGFLHYLYVAAPVSFSPHDCEGFKIYLDSQIGNHQPAIHMVQMVMRENLYGFQGNQQNPYLKITVTDPKFISKVRSTIENGHANWKGMWKTAGEGGILTFDSIQYVLRFMIDCKVSSISAHVTNNSNGSRSLGCHGLKFLRNHTLLSLQTNDSQIARSKRRSHTEI